jgi:hypothetical protein
MGPVLKEVFPGVASGLEEDGTVFRSVRYRSVTSGPTGGATGCTVWLTQVALCGIRDQQVPIAPGQSLYRDYQTPETSKGNDEEERRYDHHCFASNQTMAY